MRLSRHRLRMHSGSTCPRWLFRYSDPTNIGRAIADTLSRIASSTDVVIVSFARELPTILAPPETRRTTGTFAFGSTLFRRTPLLTMRASACGSRGSMVFLGCSSLWVGPIKYPWSTASITVLPVSGLIILERRFWRPQSKGYYTCNSPLQYTILWF